MRIKTQKFKRQRSSDGFTMSEIMVTCVLMITSMSFVTMMCVQANQIWKDIGHRRVAICELNNNLEVLTQMNSEDATSEVGLLKVSPECLATLSEAVISGSVVADNLGTRIELEIDWKRRFPGAPVKMSGWILNQPPKSEDKE
ncbi:MAG: hypothetical protein AB8B55_00695 [Mariniblastus sp.]